MRSGELPRHQLDQKLPRYGAKETFKDLLCALRGLVRLSYSGCPARRCCLDCCYSRYSRCLRLWDGHLRCSDSHCYFALHLHSPVQCSSSGLN